MLHYYYWLIPDHPHRAALQRTIDQFAQVYEGPRFVPHITIGSGMLIPEPPVLCAPIISFDSVQSEDNFFRSLYYTCAISKDLRALREALSKETSFHPHLSLVYGQHSAARRRDWCSHLPLYAKEVCCSELWVVQGGANIADWKPIKKYTLNRESAKD